LPLLPSSAWRSTWSMHGSTRTAPKVREYARAASSAQTLGMLLLAYVWFYHVCWSTYLARQSINTRAQNGSLLGLAPPTNRRNALKTASRVQRNARQPHSTCKLHALHSLSAAALFPCLTCSRLSFPSSSMV
jgi:hypothetical protein